MVDNHTVWTTVPLADLVLRERPITYGIVQAGPHVPDGVPYIRVSDMTKGYLTLNGMLRTSHEIATTYRRSTVRSGDIVFALRGSPGLVLLVSEELDGANLTQGTARLSPSDKVTSDYLLWAIRSDLAQSDIRRRIKGSTFKELTLDELGKVQVPLAPLSEQCKIAQILGTWEAAIARVEKHIAALQLRKKGLMQLLLTGKVRFSRYSDTEWRVDRFDSFLVLQRGFDLPVQERQSGAVPILASNGQIGQHNDSRVGGPGVVTGRSGTIGSVHYVDTDFWPLNTTLYVRDFHGSCPKFVYYFLQQFDLSRFATGSGVPTLNRNDVHPIMVSFPEISEQTRIADVLTDCDEELSLHAKKLAALHQQKKGLMQRLLTGRERVNVDGD